MSNPKLSGMPESHLIAIIEEYRARNDALRADYDRLTRAFEDREAHLHEEIAKLRREHAAEKVREWGLFNGQWLRTSQIVMVGPSEDGVGWWLTLADGTGFAVADDPRPALGIPVEEAPPP